MAPKITEGEGTIPFAVPAAGKPCETWYKIVGNLSSSQTPLVVVHGGPGLSHDYLIQIQDLEARYGIPVIFYDQVGNGKSTHLPHKAGDVLFWTEQIFFDELDNLIAHLGLREKGYDVLGHSWGGMFGATWAATRPEGLRKLVLSNAPASMAAWEKAFREYRKELPEDVQEVLRKGEEAEDWDGEEYTAAMTFFLKRHCSLVGFPEEFLESFAWSAKDPTVSRTMIGPNEFEATGNLRSWTAAKACKSINVPTLVINGMNEGANDDAIKPFLDEILEVKWVKFHKSTHMPLYEEKELYLKTVGEWLLEN